MICWKCWYTPCCSKLWNSGFGSISPQCNKWERIENNPNIALLTVSYRQISWRKKPDFKSTRYQIHTHFLKYDLTMCSVQTWVRNHVGYNYRLLAYFRLPNTDSLYSTSTLRAYPFFSNSTIMKTLMTLENPRKHMILDE